MPREQQFGGAVTHNEDHVGGWDMAAMEAAYKAGRRTEKTERPSLGDDDGPNIRRIKPEESRALESNQEVAEAFNEVKAKINTGELAIGIQSIFKITEAEKAFKRHDLKASYAYIDSIPDLPANMKGQLLGVLARHGENVSAVYKNIGKRSDLSVERPPQPTLKRGDEFARPDERTVALDVSALRTQAAAPPKPRTGIRGWLRNALGLKET
jgi:hypothetical protein